MTEYLCEDCGCEITILQYLRDFKCDDCHDITDKEVKEI